MPGAEGEELEQGEEEGEEEEAGQEEQAPVEHPEQVGAFELGILLLETLSCQEDFGQGGQEGRGGGKEDLEGCAIIITAVE